MKRTAFSHFIQRGATAIAILMLVACSAAPAAPATSIPPGELKLTPAGETLKINGQGFGDEWPSSLFTGDGSRIWFIAHFLQAP